MKTLCFQWKYYEFLNAFLRHAEKCPIDGRKNQWIFWTCGSNPRAAVLPFTLPWGPFLLGLFGCLGAILLVLASPEMLMKVCLTAWPTNVAMLASQQQSYDTALAWRSCWHVLAQCTFLRVISRCLQEQHKKQAMYQMLANIWFPTFSDLMDFLNGLFFLEDVTSCVYSYTWTFCFDVVLGFFFYSFFNLLTLLTSVTSPGNEFHNLIIH